MPFSCIPFESSSKSQISGNILTRFRKLVEVPRLIQKKFINYGNALKINYSQKNQSNADEDTASYSNLDITPGQTIKCENYKVSGDISLLYCKDPYNQIYQVAFRTCNVRVSPLHIRNRKITDFDNDKQTQSVNKVKYQELCNFRSGSFWLTKRIFFLVKKKNKKGTYRRSNKVNPAKGFQNDDVEKHREALKTGHGKIIPDPVGELHLSYEEMTFRVRCETLNLDVMKNTLFDHAGHMHSFPRDFAQLNSATVVAKYQMDILQIKFDICQVTIQQVNFKKEQSSQVIDENTYIPYTSDTTNRRVHIPIALSTFYYVDPMIKLRNINRFNSLNKIEPQWMKKVREKRLRKCGDSDKRSFWEVDSVNSVVHVETDGVTFKMKGGIAHVKHILNLTKYESYIIKHQRNTLEKKWEKIRSAPKKESFVPEWNLETNNA